MNSDAGGMGLGIVGGIIYVAIVVLMIVSMWKIFTKAGQPGWACLIPIYNLVVVLKIAGKPVWWIILLLIPLVNLVVMIMVFIALAKAFDKGTGFAIGMILLSFIFMPMLAFSDAKYTAPAAA